MATAVDFKGTNRRLGAPEGRDDVYPLTAFSNGCCCVTCWHLTDEEIAEIVRTGKVWLSLFSGATMPPAFVGTEDAVRDLCVDYGGTFPRQPSTDRGAGE